MRMNSKGKVIGYSCIICLAGSSLDRSGFPFIVQVFCALVIKERSV
jgi:hypothetical protein